jgi:DNA-binding PadR family transcriptional regulator
MEISQSLYYFLLVLNQPLHGYQIMQEIQKASKGSLSMGPGTCYGLISRCLDDKLIVFVKEEKRKKIYQISLKGKILLENELKSLEQQVELTKLYFGGSHV